MLMTKTTLYLYPDIFRDLSTSDQRPHKLELRIARGRIGDLDLLEATYHEMPEEQAFLFGGHRSC